MNLERWAEPAPQDKILIELGKMRLSTVAKDLSQDDLKIQVTIYLEKLRSYPAEAVESVLTSYADHNKWWPAWADLYEQLESHCFKRKKTLQALRDYSAPDDTPKDSGKDWQSMSDAEKAAHDEMMQKIRNAADGCKL